MTYEFILRTVAYSNCIGIKISHYYDIKLYLIFLFEAIPEQWNSTVNTSPSFIKALQPVLPLSDYDRQESRCSLIVDSGTLMWHTGQWTVIRIGGFFAC